MIILNIILNSNIVECEPPQLDNSSELYIKYSSYENFKEYYDLEIINNTPLILNQWEPLSMTYLRTGLYILNSLECTLEDQSLHAVNIADQFYDNMLTFDPAVINNIILNITAINTELNSRFLYEVIQHYLYIDIDNDILTPFTRRDLNLINEGHQTVTSLDLNIKFKHKVDLVNPCKLQESPYMTDNVALLISDIQRRVGIYQNIYSTHNLPPILLDKIISDTVTKYHTNTHYWNDFNNCSYQIKCYMASEISADLEHTYLNQPHVSKLNLEIYNQTNAYFKNV